MKKTILSLLTLMSSGMAVKAQQPGVGTISIIPRIGLSLANLPGDKVYVWEGMPFSAQYKAGVLAGVDVDWQFMPNLSVMVGAQYVQQGCKYKNSSTEHSVSGDAVVNGVGYSDWTTQLHYVNVPIMLNGYIAPGFALKAGVQIGFPLSGKMKYTTQEYTKTKDGIQYGEMEKQDCNLNSTLTKVTFAIPVGVSYEFSNVIIDARYNIGLTRFQKIKDFESSKNSVFTISAAYRLCL